MALALLGAARSMSVLESKYFDIDGVLQVPPSGAGSVLKFIILITCRIDRLLK